MISDNADIIFWNVNNFIIPPIHCVYVGKNRGRKISLYPIGRNQAVLRRIHSFTRCNCYLLLITIPINCGKWPRNQLNSQEVHCTFINSYKMQWLVFAQTVVQIYFSDSNVILRRIKLKNFCRLNNYLRIAITQMHMCLNTS